MKATGTKQKALFLTAVNAVVRALGLFLRVLLSRMLGAEIMGIAELAQGVHMIAITPLTSGLPMAISRMTARAKERDRQKPLLAGIRLVRVFAVILIPLLLLLSPFIARHMGDVRVLPSLWFTAPCIMILGYSAVFNGYCYGLDQSRIPAFSELIEQVARLVFSLVFLTVLGHLTAPWMAALPVAATMFAETIGLWFVLGTLHISLKGTESARNWCKPILRLAAPTTLTRLVQTLLRSFTAILIPRQLQQSGLSMAESTARLGMFSGMVFPILMLPCVFTAALSMVSLPRLAKAEEDPKELKRLLTLCFGSALPVGVVCSLAIYSCAPLLANKVYRMAELADLFRFSAPLTLLFALGHTGNGILAALGQQKRSMYGALCMSLITLALTCALTSDSSWRLNGVILAQMIGQMAGILWNVGVLLLWCRQRHHKR